MPHLRSVDQLMRSAVEETLAALTLTPKDAAAVALARRYADVMDLAMSPRLKTALKAETTEGVKTIAVDDLTIVTRIGPQLFAVLEALGAISGKARPGEPAGGYGSSGLSRLRGRCDG